MFNLQDKHLRGQINLLKAEIKILQKMQKQTEEHFKIIDDAYIKHLKLLHGGSDE